MLQPPLRGCVLKRLLVGLNCEELLAAASARLCVETLMCTFLDYDDLGSRLRAAVC